jgi:thiazole synthase
MDPAGESDPFVVAGTRLSSRLLVGTGKFSAHPVMRDAVLASGTNLVTVALRRVDLDRLGDGDILDFIPAPSTPRRPSGWPGSAGPAPAPTGSSSR